MDGSTTLADLDEEQRYAVFDLLQQQLPQVWDVLRRDRRGVGGRGAVDQPGAHAGVERHAHAGHGGRCLFQLLLLRQPMLRLVYVTSLPIADEIIEYYLACSPA